MKVHHFFLYWASALLLAINFFAGAAEITSLNPALGPVAGGTAVTILGSGFTGTTSVTFDGIPGAFVVNSDNSISAISPAHSPQVISVIVTAPSGVSPATPNSFYTYQGNWQVYVSNTDSDTVSVIDSVSDLVVATVPVGIDPRAIAITPNGTKVLTANGTSGSVSIINAGTNAVIATPLVGITPTAIGVTPDGTKAYVANSGNATVSVIDMVTNTVIVTIGVGSLPVAIAISPDSSRVYVANSGSDTVSVIDTATNTVIATPAVGNSPVTLAVTPNGREVYVVNSVMNGSVSVIQTATNAVIATVDVGNTPQGVAITPDGTKVYIANNNDTTVSVIDTASHAIITTVAVGNNPNAIAVTPNGAEVFVVNSGDGTVSIIETVNDTVVSTPAVGTLPFGIVFTPNGAKAYVVNLLDGTVSVIDTSNNIVTDTPTVGNFPNPITITPDQAPLAKFTASIALIGSPSTFDGSASNSPTGTIVNYLWNFGDGNFFSDSQPLAFHTYTIPGNYQVTLTVTNSTGTSTTQIFNSFASFNNLATSNAAINNNGGPTARASQFIFVPAPAPFPPRNLRGRLEKNVFATQTDYVNVIIWRAPNRGVRPVAYRIFRNSSLTKLVGSVSAEGKLRFEDHNRRKGKTYRYFIVSVDQFGTFSEPATIVVRGDGKCSF